MTVSVGKIVPLSAKRTWFLSAVLAAFGTVVCLGIAGFRANLTPSEPLGLWRIINLDRAVRIGDLVFVCPPVTDIMREARRRGYLRRGLCAGDIAPLIKTVAAASGQVVEIDGDVHIDGKRLPLSQVMLMDGQGRRLVPYGGGVVPSDAVYLHSDFPGSFDSRYFGPLPTENILGLAQEVWTYAP
ncbi:conjugative transfer signal peptidase TraF [Rhizobium sp. ARZ01]|uniref:conjugative transfer signal peptidase TraF n=1 Tax=Rhizobium sp. ARZ01 TaxID=2769313 RepID=UPI00177C4D1B|nr:conjugative transfer signal peptidase TraF [Rhizobium sp. ARZ01]MBD9375477.1 conjugative transfer signal peptidase TraF [Rhizobium sp. ARZ01]